MTAKQFLESKDIKLETTCLMTMIDGHMRQPDLCLIMEQYADLKIKELDMKLEKEFIPGMVL
jgi:hypothetical protein